MRPNVLSLSLALCLAMPAAVSAAETIAPDGAVVADSGGEAIHELDREVVVATRAARALVDVPNTVDVIDRETMDDRLVRDLKDLFRYEPGISVPSGFGRFGIGDIRIRGLGGNRVLIQTDGIPVPDAFSIGSFSNANRNFVDLDTLKQVEVLRGPGSSLYGSDALGGVVSFQTKDPEDYLTGGKRSHVGIKFGYESDWNGLFGGATVAAGGDRWSGMVAVGHRQGVEQDNQGERAVDGAQRTVPNPQERDGRSLLAKLVFAPSDTQRWRLTVEGNEDSSETDVRSGRGFSALTNATVSAQYGNDHQTRARVALAHEMDALNAGFADTLQWNVYRQDSETTQRTDEFRTTAAGARQRRQRTFNFDQRLMGVEAVLSKQLQFGSTEHVLTYGAELARTEIRQKRDGLATNLVTGVSTPVISPDNFPVRDFPNSRSTTAALFVQDEISFADGGGEGTFRLVPALRVDHYALRPTIDTIFAADNPGVAAVDLDETSIAPKLGAVWKFAPDWSLFAGYARGFRAPPYADVNIGFTNLAFGYTAIANPDLKPETSDGFEAGVRYGGEGLWFGLSVYDNRYRDFIESLSFVGVNNQGLQVFQSRNIADARIRGAELKGGVDFGTFNDALAGWSLRGAAAYARGEDRTKNAPLNSIDPLRGSLGLAYNREQWGAELAGIFAEGKDKSRVTDNNFYRPAGYAVFDLLTHWRFPSTGVRLNLGVFNLADRKYTDWADVPGVSSSSQTLDRYTRAGRSFAASVSVDW